MGHIGYLFRLLFLLYSMTLIYLYVWPLIKHYHYFLFMILRLETLAWNRTMAWACDIANIINWFGGTNLGCWRLSAVLKPAKLPSLTYHKLPWDFILWCTVIVDASTVFFVMFATSVHYPWKPLDQYVWVRGSFKTTDVAVKKESCCFTALQRLR